MSMRAGRRIAAAAIALACAGWTHPAAAQQPAPAAAPSAAASAFRDEIGKLYPRSFDEQKKKGGVEKVAAGLDRFWNKVKADKALYLPLLRAELVREGNPPFFYFDGSQLLVAASDISEDGALALSVIERADLEMVNLAGYLTALNGFVNRGYDTRRAALRWMDKPREQIIVQPLPHTFYYTPLEALTFSLFGMDERAFVGDLVARLQAERDDHAIQALIQAIWATATPEGRSALAAFAEDASRPEAARKFARDMLAHKGDGPPPAKSEEELRRDRRAVIADPFQHGSFNRFHAITDELVKVAR